ncbi:MAG: hypothetical protein ACOX5R_13270 [bacterium]|jgi:hypothetical protein
MDNQDFIVIANSPRIEELDVMRATLELYGIDSFLLDEHQNSATRYHFMNARLAVGKSEVRRAIMILTDNHPELLQNNNLETKYNIWNGLILPGLRMMLWMG